MQILAHQMSICSINSPCLHNTQFLHFFCNLHQFHKKCSNIAVNATLLKAAYKILHFTAEMQCLGHWDIALAIAFIQSSTELYMNTSFSLTAYLTSVFSLLSLFAIFLTHTGTPTALHAGILKWPIKKQYHAKSTWWCCKPQATDLMPQ